MESKRLVVKYLEDGKIEVGGKTYAPSVEVELGNFYRCLSNNSSEAYAGDVYLCISDSSLMCVCGASEGSYIGVEDFKRDINYWDEITQEEFKDLL